MNAENWYDGEVTNVKFDQVETSLDFFARIVDRSGFWIDDLKQSGRLSVLSSKALGFTKSQSLGKAFLVMRNDYNRNLRATGQSRKVEFISGQEIDSIYASQDEMTVEDISRLLDSFSVLPVTDRVLLKLVLCGESQKDIARWYGLQPYQVTRHLNRIRENLVRLYRY